MLVNSMPKVVTYGNSQNNAPKANTFNSKVLFTSPVDTFSSYSKARNKISFGYDLKLHESLIAVAKEIKEDFIVNLAESCKKLEDKISALELKPASAANDHKIATLANKQLIPAKKTLIEIVEDSFPELNYKNREIDDYLATADTLEDKRINSEWRYTLCDKLTEENTPKSSVNYIITAQSPLSLQPPNMTNAPAAKQDTASISSKLFEKFEPNEESPHGFDDIAGMDDLKEELKTRFIDPLLHPEIAEKNKKYGIKIPNGELLFGYPGCGKTYLMEALAGESGFPLYKMNMKELGTKFIHETSKNIGEVFDKLENIAKDTKKPVIAFFDEFDSFAQANDGKDFKSEELGTLKQELNKAASRGIFVVAATNSKNGLNDAIVRSGRFDLQHFIDLPSVENIGKQLVKSLKKIPMGIDLSKDEVAIKALANASKGFSNSDVDVVLQEAAVSACAKDTPITKDEMIDAIKKNEFRKAKDHQKYADQKKLIKNNKIGFQPPEQDQLAVVASKTDVIKS